MRQTFLYLFIFSLLVNFFLYINSNKIINATESDIAIQKEKVKTLQDSLTKQAIALDNFSLASDNEAQAELNIQPHEVESLEISLRDALIKMNDKTANGNPLVSYPPMHGEKNLISKIKVLNHRWVIADFYAGRVRGSLLLKYFVNEDKSFDFEVMNSVLYQF